MGFSIGSRRSCRSYTSLRKLGSRLGFGVFLFCAPLRETSRGVVPNTTGLLHLVSFNFFYWCSSGTRHFCFMCGHGVPGLNQISCASLRSLLSRVPRLFWERAGRSARGLRHRPAKAEVSPASEREY